MIKQHGRGIEGGEEKQDDQQISFKETNTDNESKLEMGEAKISRKASSGMGRTGKG